MIILQADIHIITPVIPVFSLRIMFPIICSQQMMLLNSNGLVVSVYL